MHRLLLVLALLGTAAAQETPAEPSEPAQAGQPADAAEAPEAPEAEDVRALLDLPSVADDMREHGVENKEVVEALKAAHESRLKGRELAEVMRTADRAAVEHGASQGMGSFVREALAEGKRGQDLADAIREAHAKRGGPPDIRGGGKPEGAGGGKPEGAGAGTRGGGKPDDAGAGTRGGGKPEGAGAGTRGGGKPEDAGAGTRGGAGGTAPTGDAPGGTRTRGGASGAPTTPPSSSPPTRTRGG